MNDKDMNIQTSIDSLFICERGQDSELYPFRVADFDHRRQQVVPFVPERDVPYAFDNRNRLQPFHREGRGVVFCANWKTIRNNTDPEKDYVLPRLETLPIKIYGVSDRLARYAVKDIALQLKKGVPDPRIAEHPVFFLSVAHAGSRMAVLCTPDDVQRLPGGGVGLKDSVYSLPYFRLPAAPVRVMTSTNVYLYYPFYGDLGLARVGLCPTDERYDQVRNYIRTNLLNKANLKDAGASRNEMQRIRDIFEALKPKIDVSVIAAAISCSPDEARTALEAICRDVDQLAKPSEIEESFARGLIDSSEVLAPHFMTVWEKSHAADLAAAESEREARVQKCRQDVSQAEAERDRQLEDMKSALARKREESRKEMERLEESVSDRRGCLSSLDEELSSRRTLLKGVREETENLLAQTYDAVARTLVTAQIVKAVTVGQASAPVVEDSKPERDLRRGKERSAFQKGIPLQSDQVDEESEWTLLQENLEICGVVPAASPSLAAVLLAAYRLRKPILLAGPNGRAIADALSCVIRAAAADELSCEGPFDHDTLAGAFEGDGGVLVVRGGMNSSWTEAILETMGATTRMPIFLLPLSDDLAMMPRGVLDYAVSIDTQPFVTEVARNYLPDFYGRATELPVEKGRAGRVPDEVVLRRLFHCSLACEANLKTVVELASSYSGVAGLSSDFVYSAFYFAMSRVMDSLPAFNAHLSSHKGVAPSLQRFVVEEDA